MVRSRIVKKAVLKRFAVTLTPLADMFEGVLTEFDGEMFVFEDCKTVASRDGETIVKIPGRVFVERKTVAYLQERP